MYFAYMRGLKIGADKADRQIARFYSLMTVKNLAAFPPMAS